MPTSRLWRFRCAIFLQGGHSRERRRVNFMPPGKAH